MNPQAEVVYSKDIFPCRQVKDLGFLSFKPSDKTSII